MALFTRFCKAKPPYSETADQVPDSPLTSSADCYALALVGNRVTEKEPDHHGPDFGVGSSRVGVGREAESD